MLQPSTSPPQPMTAKTEFAAAFAASSTTVLGDPLLAEMPAQARTWLRQLLDQAVPGGKMTRGLTVVSTVKAMVPAGTDAASVARREALMRHATTLGWCVEWLQACFLVADDIMDGSELRRGQPCRYLRAGVGLKAVNDAFLLRSHVSRLLRRTMAAEPFYPRVVELLEEVTYQTEIGQLLDLITAEPDQDTYAAPVPAGAAKPAGFDGYKYFTQERYELIVAFKTAMYSFYLPVALGLAVAGVEDPLAFTEARGVCRSIGTYFQIQDDFLDCFADAKVLGKIGRDIEERKCSWLVIQALRRATPEQRAILDAHYGSEDKASVATVKRLYADLKLEAAYDTYAADAYTRIRDEIAQVKLLPQGIFLALLDKIHNRRK